MVCLSSQTNGLNFFFFWVRVCGVVRCLLYSARVWSCVPARVLFRVWRAVSQPWCLVIGEQSVGFCFFFYYSDYYGYGFWLSSWLKSCSCGRPGVQSSPTAGGAVHTPPPLFPPLHFFYRELQSLLRRALVNNGKCVRGRTVSSLCTTPRAPEPSPGSPKEALRIMSFWRHLCCLSDPSLCLFVYYGLLGFLFCFVLFYF